MCCTINMAGGWKVEDGDGTDSLLYPVGATMKSLVFLVFTCVHLSLSYIFVRNSIPSKPLSTYST